MFLFFSEIWDCLYHFFSLLFVQPSFINPDLLWVLLGHNIIAHVTNVPIHKGHISV